MPFAFRAAAIGFAAFYSAGNQRATDYMACGWQVADYLRFPLFQLLSCQFTVLCLISVIHDKIVYLSASLVNSQN
jgi:hypothetical protein